MSIYGANLEGGSPTISQLEEQRAKSKEGRDDLGRMGLCATEEEFATVAQLKSDDWQVLVPLSPLGAGYQETRKTMFYISEGSKSDVFTHLRVNMGPDGGIARIRVYGEVVASPETLRKATTAAGGKPIDLLSVQLGGLAVSCSNTHYGHPRNLVAPGRGNCMGDGWETARQPKRPAVYEKDPKTGLMVLPGCDWAMLKLGKSKQISYYT